MGHTEARIFTPPLVDIMLPENSYGHAVIRFASNILKQPLDPWQEWLVLRAGELLADGRPRFRQVLVLVARQNGKTFLMQVLAAYWLFVECCRMILGMSSNLQLAKETMLATVEMIDEVPHLSRDKLRVLEGNNDVHFSTKLKSVYKTSAATRKAARGKRVDRLMVDELREQLDDEAYKAGMNTMNARPYGQAWFFSNQGDDRSVVLDMLHTMATAYIADPDDDEADYRLGMFEWSAPDGMDVMNTLGWQMANPNLGRHNDEDAIRSEAKKAKRLGGTTEAGFRTEILCQRVRSLDAAVDQIAWARNLEPGKFDDEAKKNLAFCFDISLDNTHATLCAAATLSDGRIRVTELKAWEGLDCGLKLRQELPGLVETYKPRSVGWFPMGPAASIAATARERDRVKPWLPRSVANEEIRGEVAAVCMGFGALVTQDQIVHEGQPLLTTHVVGTSKKHREDTWVFTRQGGGQCDAAYAAAGAVHLARTLPTQNKVALFSVKPQER